MTNKIFIASRSYGKYSPETINFLQDNGFEIEHNELDRVYKEEDLLEIVENFDVIVVGVDEVTENVIEKGEKLKVIGKNGIGVDNIDLEAADKYGIPVVNIPGANSHSVADLTIALMLSLARSIPQVNNKTKAGKWEREIGRELWDKTVGIIGTGEIGQQTAFRVINGFNCNVLAYDVVKDEKFSSKESVEYIDDIEKILADSDFISLHVPFTKETENLIDSRSLSIMKKEAYLINTARGGVVNEGDLYQALKENEIAGAASDVFSEEPPGKHQLFELSNFIATSHIGAFTYETNRRAGIGLARDIVSVIKGSKPENLVNNPW